MTTPTFTGGANIAIKVPAAKFAETVAFYRDILGFDVIDEPTAAVGMVSRSARMAFGDCTLWLDCVENYAKADIWLELHTDHLGGAVAHLAAHGTRTQDELEQLPDGSQAHWVCNPVDVPHILHAPSNSP